MAVHEGVEHAGAGGLADGGAMEETASSVCRVAAGALRRSEPGALFPSPRAALCAAAPVALGVRASILLR